MLLRTIAFPISFASSAIVMPATSGKFFYADLEQSTDAFNNGAFHRILMLLGEDDDEKQHSFALNSLVESLQIVGKACSDNCKVPNKYDTEGAKQTGEPGGVSQLTFYNNTI